MDKEPSLPVIKFRLSTESTSACREQEKFRLAFHSWPILSTPQSTGVLGPEKRNAISMGTANINATIKGKSIAHAPQTSTLIQAQSHRRQQHIPHVYPPSPCQQSRIHL